MSRSTFSLAITSAKDLLIPRIWIIGGLRERVMDGSGMRSSGVGADCLSPHSGEKLGRPRVRSSLEGWAREGKRRKWGFSQSGGPLLSTVLAQVVSTRSATRSGSAEQPALTGVANEIDPALQAEFAGEIGPMALNGPHADVELCSDLAVGVALDNQFQNLHFTRGELLGSVVRLAGGR